jgi:methylmalonyl-CoA mutase N-terminal domain/subunit
VRQFAGFSTPEETSARHQRQNGPDVDRPHSVGEVGKCGVAISSSDDMEQRYANTPLDRVSVSMTINSPPPVLYAMSVVTAERHGVDPAILSGTLLNDILEEYTTHTEYSGAQSLHTDSLDEAYALRSEHAVTLAPRAGQIIDPLGGSGLVESQGLAAPTGLLAPENGLRSSKLEGLCVS